MPTEQQIEMTAKRRFLVPGTNRLATPGEPIFVRDDLTARQLEARGLAERSAKSKRKTADAPPAEGAQVKASEKAEAKPAAAAIAPPSSTKATAQPAKKK
jgi:hypothetical protein